MKLEKSFASLILAAVSTFILQAADAQEMPNPESSKFWVEAEAGPVWQGRNDVQVPADSGTRFSISSLESGPALSGRVYVGYRINVRHEVRALYAPLTIKVTGTFDNAVSFENQTFASGVATDAKYTFNSYRLTYRYRFYDDDFWVLRVGFTGKIRDANIRLSQGALSAETDNIGFVPLLHFAAVYSLSSHYRLNLDVDALAAPQGRAEDVALFASYSPDSRLEYRLGYRTLEGGADGGGGVYTFAWLHYATAGMQYNF